MQRRSYIVPALAACGVAVLLAAGSPASAQQAGPGPGGPGPGGPAPGMGPGGEGHYGSPPIHDRGQAVFGPDTLNGGSVPQGNDTVEGTGSIGWFGLPLLGNLFGSKNEGDPVSGTRPRVLGHDDALTAREAGTIIPFKDALKAANPTNAKVIEVKLIANDKFAVYRIKLRFDDGSIKSVTVNARTGDVGGLY